MKRGLNVDVVRSGGWKGKDLRETKDLKGGREDGATTETENLGVSPGVLFFARPHTLLPPIKGINGN
jgi:hypothetical protein